MMEVYEESRHNSRPPASTLPPSEGFGEGVYVCGVYVCAYMHTCVCEWSWLGEWTRKRYISISCPKRHKSARPWPL